MQSYPSSSLIVQESHQAFVEELVVNSMMYKHFKEDKGRGLGEETARLLTLPQEERRNYLFNKFNMISSQAQYPLRFDNERKWIRYYDRVSSSRKKNRFNRYSLNTLDMSRFSSSLGFTSSSSFVSSPQTTDNRVLLRHSTVFQ